VLNILSLGALLDIVDKGTEVIVYEWGKGIPLPNDSKNYTDYAERDVIEITATRNANKSYTYKGCLVLTIK
jgi:hypothetical protein